MMERHQQEVSVGQTRIQSKSRKAKKVIGQADYDIFTGNITNYKGKWPRADPRAYKLYYSIGYPVVVGLVITDSTP